MFKFTKQTLLDIGNSWLKLLQERSKMKRVGILGGMGPEATILLMQKVLAGVDADDDLNHVPMIVHQNTQVPSRIDRILNFRGENPGPVLQKMANDLQYMKCDFLAMPCNTAHYYFTDIKESVKIPLLNMIELTAQELSKRKLFKVGVLASPAARRINVFNEIFNQYGLESKFSNDDISMLKIIQTIKKGSLDDTIIEKFKYQVSILNDSKCDAILIACTELSLMRDYVPNDLSCLDSLDCLASKVILTAKGSG